MGERGESARRHIQGLDELDEVACRRACEVGASEEGLILLDLRDLADGLALCAHLRR